MAPRLGDGERFRGALRSGDRVLRERFATAAPSLVLRVAQEPAALAARVAVEVTAGDGDFVHVEVQPGRLCPDPRNQAVVQPSDLGERVVLDVTLQLGDDVADRGGAAAPPLVRLSVPRSVRSLSVECGRGPLTAEAVECDQLALYATAGDLTVSRCTGFIVATLGRGRLALHEVEGEASCSLGHGPVDVRSCRGRFRVSVGEGDVTGSDFMGSSLTIDCGAGDVNVSEALAEALEVRLRRGQVALTSFSTAALTVAVGTGSCSCSGDLAEGTHTLEVERGNLVLEAANDTPLRFDLTTGAGEIVCPLPSVQVGRRGRPSSRGQRLVGVYRAGTVHLNASVGRGDLTLRLSEPES
jgi:hypothetical protein